MREERDFEKGNSQHGKQRLPNTHNERVVSFFFVGIQKTRKICFGLVFFDVERLYIWLVLKIYICASN